MMTAIQQLAAEIAEKEEPRTPSAYDVFMADIAKNGRPVCMATVVEVGVLTAVELADKDVDALTSIGLAIAAAYKIGLEVGRHEDRE
jgi:hypothetical protein